MERISWRQEARIALRSYPALKRKQSDKGIRITSVYDGGIVRNRESRATENAALSSSLTDAEENIVIAVEAALELQQKRSNCKERERMIQLVYFARSHNLDGAAMDCHYSPEAIDKWNTEILSAVYSALLVARRIKSGKY